APELRVEPPGGELADEVGQGARGGALVAEGAERGAHPPARLARPAEAAAVAAGGRLHRPPLAPAAHRPERAVGPVRGGGWVRFVNVRRGRGGGQLLGPGGRPGRDGSRGGPRAEVAGGRVRRVADDFAGVEQVQRVEGVLDLAEDRQQVAEL